MRVFGIFGLLKISLVPSKKYDTTKVLIWDELLFLFFVSITLFVEIMSRISNCFFNFKLRCEKGDDFFESPPFRKYILIFVDLKMNYFSINLTAVPYEITSAAPCIIAEEA